jgi:Family of unknown function (DUF6263)
MKKHIFLFAGILASNIAFCQTGANKPMLTNKIVLNKHQKIEALTNVSMEASLSQGMDIVNKTSSVNVMEVKDSTTGFYTITNTLTKLKVDMEMMGQSNNFDSEKKEDLESEVGKNFAGRLNKPQDVIINNITGKDTAETKKVVKKEDDESNPTGGLLSMFADNSNEATVTGAFELIPQGKNVGDSWSDSSNTKDLKVTRNFTLKSITGNEAIIQINIVMDANNTVELQGMSMEFTSNTKTTGEIITDIMTGQVKQRTTVSDITGSFQVMGQAVPVTAKASSTTTYK